MALPRRLALPHGIRARPTRLANSPGALTMALTRDRTRDQKRFEIREQVMDARASRYQEVYARSQRDPQAFWSEAAADIDWIEWPSRCSIPRRACTAAGSRTASATPAGTRSTATFSPGPAS